MYGVSPDLTRYFGDGNLANYTSTEVSNILTELYSISDRATLKEKYQTLQTIYEEDRAYIGLYFNRQTVIYSKSISGSISPTWYNIFYNIESWNKKS